MMHAPESEKQAEDSDQGITTLSAQLGVPLQIHLWEDRTRGEQWVPTYEATAVVLTGDDFLRIASNNAVDSGRRTFEFQPVSVGEHRLVFEKRMGWKFTAEDRRVFRILVSDGSTVGEVP
jgi:predicted secreted protein